MKLVRKPAERPQTFAAILRRRNPHFAAALKRIRRRAVEEWVHLLGEDKGSHTGYIHLHNVERNIEKMIPQSMKQEFSDGEILLILSAALLHDIGKIVPSTLSPATSASGQQQIRCPLTGWGHHCASKWIIDNLWGELGLPDSTIAGYCGLLAYSHNIDDPPAGRQSCLESQDCTLAYPKAEAFRSTSLEPYGRLRIPLLASMLRIADECENHWTRALRSKTYEIWVGSGRNVGKAFRRHIEDVEFCHEGECIVMHVPSGIDADPDTEALMVGSLASAAEKAERVLHRWRLPLQQIGVVFDRVYFEHAGALYRDASFGFRGSPKLSSVLSAADAEVVRSFCGVLRQLVPASQAGTSIDWQSVELLMRRELTLRERWLLKQLGVSEHAWTMVIRDGKERIAPQSLEMLADVEGQLDPRAFATGAELQTAEDRELQIHLLHELQTLHAGTLGFERVTWQALETRIQLQLGPHQRRILMRLGELDPGIEINPDKGSDAFKVRARPGSWAAALKKAGAIASKPGVASLLDEVADAVAMLYQQSGGYPYIRWDAIEAYRAANRQASRLDPHLLPKAGIYKHGLRIGPGRQLDEVEVRKAEVVP